MEEESVNVRTEEQIRTSVFGSNIAEVHLGNYDHSITRPTVASARKSVLWSRERKVYETSSRRRLDEFKGNPYFRFEYPEIPRHWPGTWAVMTSQDLDVSAGRLSRPTTGRPRTSPLHTWMRGKFKTQDDVQRTVKTPMVIVN
ncbi:uncharacterized protein LOC132759895 [Ruditapes philippinarum]|uniref:uncharacterized protein LOC132759895 n=1 Tax=Ruditapes philippinarum TaxID=129788 RepID=UPI00295A5E28|nr:uncharacterized protein LOC132759895 [Ruditapes philippinarum]XP_060607752.1 uncharacterized protein LOC132759895 [Ruditapes philippinarum]